MPIKLIATCLTPGQEQACKAQGIEIIHNYARALGEITPGCVTDFSIHCFNSETLAVLKTLGASRATLHPELNLAQIRDIKKHINTEAIIYGKIPLMKLGNPIQSRQITDRTGTTFPINSDTIYNSVPIYMADKLTEIEKSGITHSRLIFTNESPDEIQKIIESYKHQKPPKTQFTRGKYYSKV